MMQMPRNAGTKATSNENYAGPIRLADQALGGRSFAEATPADRVRALGAFRSARSGRDGKRAGMKEAAGHMRSVLLRLHLKEVLGVDALPRDVARATHIRPPRWRWSGSHSPPAFQAGCPCRRALHDLSAIIDEERLRSANVLGDPTVQCIVRIRGLHGARVLVPDLAQPVVRVVRVRVGSVREAVALRIVRERGGGRGRGLDLVQVSVCPGLGGGVAVRGRGHRRPLVGPAQGPSKLIGEGVHVVHCADL
jgi:hypothetical protein